MGFYVFNLIVISGSNIQEERQRVSGFLLLVQNYPGMYERNPAGFGLSQHFHIYYNKIINIMQVWNAKLLFFQVFSEYFKELEEESIRDNFVIIYELMDELMDFGYPQTTDSKILQE